MTETEAVLIICGLLQGTPEKTYYYDIAEGRYSGRVDCITNDYAIEIGLDKRTSLDSVQQAQFYAWLSDKKPMVILVDRDGQVGPYEFRIMKAAAASGVKYSAITEDFLLRWRMTSYLRERFR